MFFLLSSKVKVFVRLDEYNAECGEPTVHETVCKREEKDSIKHMLLSGLAKIIDWQNLSVQAEPSTFVTL